MSNPLLKTIPLVQNLAAAMEAYESTSRFAGLPKGTLRGTVTSVEDPKNQGRVKVVFDDFNPDIPQLTGGGQYAERRVGEEPDQSHWIDVSPAFEGRQPAGLVGKRVNIVASSGQYQYAMLQDVVYDPQLLVADKAKEMTIPNNSSMTRLPVYEAGKLPPPTANNLGCMVVESGGPMNSDWVCVCLRRDGKYTWVRHSDLAHGHAGANDVTGQVDSSGNRPSPAQAASSWDHVFVTSHQEMSKPTAYGTAPRGNPWGADAAWSPAPMSDAKPLPTIEPALLDQITALSFVRETGYTDDVAGSFITSYAPNISAATSSVPGFNFAGRALKTAQKELLAAITKGLSVEDPTQYVSTNSQSTIASFIPQSTKELLAKILNPQAYIKTVLSSLPRPPKP